MEPAGMPPWPSVITVVLWAVPFAATRTTCACPVAVLYWPTQILCAEGMSPCA